jgi:uncharacterized repeat protein (TIGR01451 family)
MFKGHKFIAIAILACGFGSQAFAQGAQGCIVLKSTAEIKKEVVDQTGAKSTKMVPAEKVVPGTEVTWTITADNVCKKPSDNVTINNAVPPHMTYVANSATGPGSEITFSLDGTSFAKPADLTVKEDGATRTARADEYKHIRWVFKDSLAPGATAQASFRAVLN